MQTHERLRVPVDFRLLNETAEKEPFPHRRVVMTCTEAGLSRALAVQLARAGYPVTAGTGGPMAEEQFADLEERVQASGGVKPNFFPADMQRLIHDDGVEDVYRAMGLAQGEMVHYIPFGLSGTSSIEPFFKTRLMAVDVGTRTNSLTVDVLAGLTSEMRHIALSAGVVQAAEDQQYYARLRLLELLVERGHIDSQSVIVDVTNRTAFNADPRNPDSFQGPWLAWPEARALQMASTRLRRYGANGLRYRGFVTDHPIDPSLELSVGLIGNRMHAALPATVPPVHGRSIDFTAYCIARELVNPTVDPLDPDDALKQAKTYFVTETGIENELPEDWKKPIIPYF